MSGFSRALRILDEVQNIAALESLDPDRFVDAIDDLPQTSRLARSDENGPASALLGEIDRFAAKCMRIRMDHLTCALPPKIRLLFSATIVAYEREPSLLRGRIAGILGRADPANAASLTDQICDAAVRVLATRQALRLRVIDRAQRAPRAGAAAPAALPRPPAGGETSSHRGASIQPTVPAPIPVVAEATEPDPTSTRFSLLELD